MTDLGPFTNLLDRRDDIGIGSAAADVAAHQFLDRRVIRTAGFLEQRNRRHDLTGRAVATLVTVAGNECRLHGMQCAGRAQAFNRGDLFPVVHQGQAKAGVNAPAIHMHRARAALPVIATLLGAGERDGFTDAIEQRGSRVNAKLVTSAVDAQRDRNGPLDIRRLGCCRRRTSLNDIVARVVGNATGNERGGRKYFPWSKEMSDGSDSTDSIGDRLP